MAFTQASVNVVQPLIAPNGKLPQDGDPKLWFYVSPDNTATTEAAHYFDGFSAYVNVGDYIWAICTDGAHLLHVSANAGGVVTFGAIAVS